MRVIFGLSPLVLLLPLCLRGGALDEARAFYQSTQYDRAVPLLQGPAKNGDRGAQMLLGQTYFRLGDYKKSIELFEAMAAKEPSDAGIQLWLGRTWGRRAETANPLFAAGHAGKARAAFEKSVSLDGKNLDALDDLFSYYLDAPGFLGGGVDKAEGIAARMAALNPVQGHTAAARIAEKRKDFSNAEMNLRKAMELAPEQVGRVLGLAKLLSKEGKVAEADALLKKADAMAPGSPKVMYEKANIYIKAKRNLPEAQRLLNEYLGTRRTPDDPSREEAETLLKQAKSAAGT